MPRKKQFINKKTATTFHLVSRTQNDPLVSDPNASKYVLVQERGELPENFPTEVLLDMELAQETGYEHTPAHLLDVSDDDSGFEDDDFKGERKKKKKKKPSFNHAYDYTKHLKPIGTGYLFTADTPAASVLELRAQGEEKSEKEFMKELGIEVPDEKDLPKDEDCAPAPGREVAPTQDFFDALEGEEDDFEELADNFVVEALVETDADREAWEKAKAEGKFHSGGLFDPEDYDEDDLHDYEEGDYEGEEGEDYDEENEDRDDDDEDAARGPYGDLNEDGEEDEEDEQRPMRELDAQFANLLANEYQDELIGDLEGEEEVAGVVEDEDAFLTSAVQAINTHTTKERSRLPGVPGARAKHLNLNDPAAIQITKLHIQRLYREAENENEEEVEKKAEDEIMSMCQVPRRERQGEWDCESILSTRSNLENHPTVIKEVVRKRGQEIKLNKDGVPLMVLQQINEKRKAAKAAALAAVEEAEEEEGDEEEEDSDEEANQGAARPKKESKEDKKARKQAAKMQKKLNRQRKKELKSLFTHEEQTQERIATKQRAHNPSGVKIV